jgi:predicted DNA-binding transcriptional regulator AlpA
MSQFDSQREPGDRIVGFQELMHRLNIRSRSTVYEWIRRKVLAPPLRVGPRLRGWRDSYVQHLVQSFDP